LQWQSPEKGSLMGPTPILFIDHAQAVGGAENSLLLLLQHLDRTRWEPHLACVGGPLPRRAEDLGIATHIADLPRLRRSLRAPTDWLSATTSLASLARDVDGKCLYANTVRAAFHAALAARRARLPFIWHMRDFWLSENRPRHLWLDLALKRALCASAAHVVVNSHAVSQCLPECEKVTVVHNGIDTSHYDPRHDKKVFRVQHGIPEDAPLVGMVGRLRPWKGQTRFLRTAALVRRRCPRIHFAVVGGAPFGGADDYLAELRQTAEELDLVDRVTFTGHLHDVRPALAAMDVFVHPGEPEPFGLVNIEAMAMQTPVVAVAHGALPEIVQDGVTGALVEPRNETALAEAICQLIDDPDRRTAHGAAGRARVIKHFDIARTAIRVAEILTEVTAA